MSPLHQMDLLDPSSSARIREDERRPFNHFQAALTPFRQNSDYGGLDHAGEELYRAGVSRNNKQMIPIIFQYGEGLFFMKIPGFQFLLFH